MSKAVLLVSGPDFKGKDYYGAIWDAVVASDVPSLVEAVDLNLVSAAPRMLEVLRNAVLMLDSKAGAHDIEYVRRLAADAVAKAEGRGK